MDHLSCYICLVEANADIDDHVKAAVTIYNGMAVCRGHLGAYERPEWLTDQINRAKNAKVKARRDDGE